MHPYVKLSGWYFYPVDSNKTFPFSKPSENKQVTNFFIFIISNKLFIHSKIIMDFYIFLYLFQKILFLNFEMT